MMDCYSPQDMTTEAQKIAEEMLSASSAGAVQVDTDFPKITHRVPDRTAIDCSVRTKVPTVESILFGETEIRLHAVEQLVDHSQTRYVCAILCAAPRQWLDGRRTLAEVLDQLEDAIEQHGLDAVNGREARGDCALTLAFFASQPVAKSLCLPTEESATVQPPITLVFADARPRRFEIAAAFNRLRGLRMSQTRYGGASEVASGFGK
eukprot:SAG31_NODE_1476_length_8195_cov_2.521863_7_plen_207_part_00